MFGTGRVFKVGVSTLLTDESLPVRKEENGGKVRAEQHRQRQLSVHEDIQSSMPEQGGMETQQQGARGPHRRQSEGIGGLKKRALISIEKRMSEACPI